MAWKPAGNYKSLNDVSLAYIKKYLSLDGKPDKLARTSFHRVPYRFTPLAPLEFERRFPYGELGIVCLHVASKYRNVDMGTIDFLFNGSMLDILACRDENETIYVTQIPGTGTIMMSSKAAMEMNYATVGHQFERFVTGKSMPPKITSVQYNEHIHTMQVGAFKVLFRAEVDALDEAGNAVEITFSNPRYWGTRKMFQMISNGSVQMCSGRKERGLTVTRTDLLPLSRVVQDALKHIDIRSLEKNILDCMETIKSELEEKDTEEGQVYRVSFKDGMLTLSLSHIELLPPPKVVRELI